MLVPGNVSSSETRAMQGNAQVRVDSRDACILNGLRQRLEPPLGLPLARILAPDRFVHVTRAQVAEHQGALRDDNLVDHVAVCATNRFVKREDRVLSGPGGISH